MKSPAHRHKHVLVRFLCIFTPLAGVVILATWGIYYLQYIKTHQEILRSQEAYSQNLKAEFVKLRINTIVSDLHVIAYHRQLVDLLAGKIENGTLAGEMLSFSRYKGIYDQIRVLNNSGVEVLRVDLRGETPVQIPKEELQYKGDRYYFKDILNLKQGEVYMSRLDLNMERGEIERPLKPMIRFGMPLFDANGEKQGVMVLNYLGNELIAMLENLTFSSPGKLMLLNSSGYWLKSDNPAQEWGFMLDGRSDQTMPKQFPATWDQIKDRQAGQFLTDQGLVTFTKVYPLKEGVVSSDGLIKLEGGTTYLTSKDFFWVILSLVPSEELHSASGGFLFALVISDLFLLLLLGAISWRLTVANEKRQQAEASLRRLNRELEEKVKERTVELSNTNQALLEKIDEHNKALLEKEKMESQLRQAQKMEALGTLAGGVAHDFNNILMPITGYAEMVLMRLENDPVLRNQMNEILEAAQRAKELVRQILTFSRQTEFEPVPVSVQLIVKEVVKFLRASIPSTIRIRMDIDSGCRPVLADPTQVHQVLMNLCTNAYHAMREDGGTLSVRMYETKIGIEDYKTHFQLNPGDYLKLEVSDTGPGIKEELQEKIFEPYFTTKGKGEGTGLGLSVVHSIIQNMEGHISVYSEFGKGTTFHIYLPVIDAVKEDVAKQAKERPAAGTERILIVDDEDSILFFEKQALQNLGYKVTSMQNSGDALRVFGENPDRFDLLITDMTMPGMTGVELARKIHEIRSDLPTILCTGYSESVDEAKSIAMGFDAFVTKPATVRMLAKAVRSALDQAKRRSKS